MLLLFIVGAYIKNTESVRRKIRHSFSMQGFQKIKYVIPLLLLSANSSNTSYEINEFLTYKVIRKNSVIGYINIEKNTLKNKTVYSLVSEINVRFILKFKAFGDEKSVYENGILIFSSMYRRINKRVKLNHELSLTDGKYFHKDDSGQKQLELDLITRNLVTLFFSEPQGVKSIYSDKFKEMVTITSLGHNTYKITLPDKSTSKYHYKNGLCWRIELKGSFYEIELDRVIE